jgi:penicillin amidase
MNSPGQLGNPRSRHYVDLFPGWVRDEAFPLLNSRESKEAAAEQHIVLEPADRR